MHTTSQLPDDLLRIKKRLGLTLVKFESPIFLAGFHQAHLLETPAGFVDALVKHYKLVRRGGREGGREGGRRKRGREGGRIESQHLSHYSIRNDIQTHFLTDHIHNYVFHPFSITFLHHISMLSFLGCPKPGHQDSRLR